MNKLSESESNTVNNFTSTESDLDTDLDNYEIKTNICKRLSKELDLPEITYDERLKDWTPPSRH